MHIRVSACLRATLLLVIVTITSISCSQTTEASYSDRLTRPYSGLLRSVVYLHVPIEDSEKFLYGTGIVLYIDSTVVLVATARHVVDDSIFVDSLWHKTDHQSIQITAGFGTGKGRLRRFGTNIDIALIEMPSGIAASGETLVPVQRWNATGLKRGTLVGFLGYDHGLIYETEEGRKVNPFGHLGVLSGWQEVKKGPVYQNLWWFDLMIGKGGSGGPIFLAESGDVIAMFIQIKGQKLRDDYEATHSGLVAGVPMDYVWKMYDRWLVERSSGK